MITRNIQNTNVKAGFQNLQGSRTCSALLSHIKSLLLRYKFLGWAGIIKLALGYVYATGISQVPHVLVTIKPLHSLVAGIMEGIGVPDLLMDGKMSPHTHHLKPSEEQKLHKAQVIIWVGSMYETALKKRMENVTSTAQVITAAELDGLELYPYREFNVDCEGNGGCCAHPSPSHNESDHTHEISGKDGHLWLAPSNAKVLVAKIASKLATIDRLHAPRYLANSQKVIKRIDDLALELTTELKNIQGKTYITFHDFTQYFDRSFGTQCVGVVRVDPGLEPTPAHLRKLEKKISLKESAVIFIEPQFSSKLIQALSVRSPIKMAQLDYLGYGLEAGPSLYFEMMRRLSLDMKKALEEPSFFSF